MQKSTLKRMAQLLGTSVSTVSRALKDHPDISTAMRSKVKELAAELEYEPNSYAVQLRTRKSSLLGILIPSIDNFFYDSFIAAVEDEARRLGYSVMIMQSRDQAKIETANLQFFRQNMVMGVFAAVSIETENMAPFQKMEAQGIPVVFIDRVPTQESFHKVCLSDTIAASLAAEAIIDKKKKHVLALFGHPHLTISQKRKTAFEAAFATKAPKTKLQIDYTEEPVRSKEVALKALKGKNKPDVIFCMGDLILIGVMDAIHELKLKVPEDIAVIGISNGFIPSLYNPKITYVETSGFKLGQLAFKQMMARIQNESTSEIVCVESMLVAGGSL
jgi:LacI family transcriptional regulator